MKRVLSLLLWLAPINLLSQTNDSLLSTLSMSIRNDSIRMPRPELFSGGFIDIFQNGQMNAAARLFKLYIGDPGKFQLPISVYSGVSANNFSTSQRNDNITIALISPGAGFLNMRFEGINKLVGNKKSITSLQLQYQAGLRFLSAYSEIRLENITFYNLISGVGITLITGAWEKNKPNNLGAFWINLRGLYSTSPSFVFDEFFIVPVKHNFFGYSAGLGIEISQALNVKVFSFHFLNNRRVPVFTQSHLQLSFNYSMR